MLDGAGISWGRTWGSFCQPVWWRKFVHNTHQSFTRVLRKHRHFKIILRICSWNTCSFVLFKFNMSHALRFSPLCITTWEKSYHFCKWRPKFQSNCVMAFRVCSEMCVNFKYHDLPQVTPFSKFNNGDTWELVMVIFANRGSYNIEPCRLAAC